METSAPHSIAGAPRLDVVFVSGRSGQAAVMKYALLLDHRRVCAQTADPQLPLRAGSPRTASSEPPESLRQRARAYG